jgi:hypothetical protein
MGSVAGLASYFMGYYTIWLAFVKKFFRPVLGISSGHGFNRAKKHRQEIGFSLPQAGR